MKTVGRSNSGDGSRLYFKHIFVCQWASNFIRSIQIKAFNLIKNKLTCNQGLINHSYMHIYIWLFAFLYVYTCMQAYMYFSLKFVPKSLNYSSFPLTPVGFKHVLKKFSEVGRFKDASVCTADYGP